MITLYLTLNKTETVFTNENSFNFEVEKSDILHKRFSKYYDKINKLDNFFTTLVNNDYNLVKYRSLRSTSPDVECIPIDAKEIELSEKL